MYVGSP